VPTCFLVDGLIARQTSMGYTAGMLIWISVAWRIFRSRIFWPSRFSDFAFIMFTRSGFSSAGDLNGHWVSTITAIGLRLRQWEKFYHFGVTAARVTTLSLLFPGIRSSGTYSTILRFLYRGGSHGFMTRSWSGMDSLGWLDSIETQMNVLMMPCGAEPGDAVTSAQERCVW
jgi:hypothetical protein